jgi:hypothetical protein
LLDRITGRVGDASFFWVGGGVAMGEGVGVEAGGAAGASIGALIGEGEVAGVGLTAAVVEEPRVRPCSSLFLNSPKYGEWIAVWWVGVGTMGACEGIVELLKLSEPRAKSVRPVNVIDFITIFVLVDYASILA